MARMKAEPDVGIHSERKKKQNDGYRAQFRAQARPDLSILADDKRSQQQPKKCRGREQREEKQCPAPPEAVACRHESLGDTLSAR